MTDFEAAGFESIARTIHEMDKLGVDRQTTCNAIATATAKALRAALGPKGAAALLREAADRIADMLHS